MRKRHKKKLLRKMFSIVDDSANIFTGKAYKLDNSNGKSSAYFTINLNKKCVHIRTIHIPKGVKINLTGHIVGG